MDYGLWMCKQDCQPCLSFAILPNFQLHHSQAENIVTEAQDYKTWMCVICGWIYDEAKGSPDEGIAPGTRWEDVPDYWTCPDCGAGKEDFELIEI